MKTIFPEYRVRLERVRRGHKAVVLPYPASLGQRTKLGGEPDWINSDETPSCKECQQPMAFVVQIDSIDYTGSVTRGPYMFGDVGMLYLFYCVDCGGTAVVEQS